MAKKSESRLGLASDSYSGREGKKKDDYNNVSRREKEICIIDIDKGRMLVIV
jgi:hypothetical protein